MTPCPTLLRLLIEYEPETGVLRWKDRSEWTFKKPNIGTAKDAMEKWNRKHAGTRAFICPHTNGYLAGTVFGKKQFAHRVAFAIAHGKYPEIVDHINGDRADNRLCNLRSATATENSRNTSSRGKSRSRFLGVRWDQAAMKWHARIRVDGKVHHLGTFTDEVVAARTYDAAAKQHFGAFARPNFQ